VLFPTFQDSGVQPAGSGTLIAPEEKSGETVSGSKSCTS
jgi:hypothetical protein